MPPITSIAVSTTMTPKYGRALAEKLSINYYLLLVRFLLLLDRDRILILQAVRAFDDDLGVVHRNRRSVLLREIQDFHDALVVAFLVLSGAASADLDLDLASNEFVVLILLDDDHGRRLLV